MRTYSTVLVTQHKTQFQRVRKHPQQLQAICSQTEQALYWVYKLTQEHLMLKKMFTIQRAEM